ncbi:MAG: hypothetical protein AAF389_11235 [Gemmatimonadota bacterium]
MVFEDLGRVWRDESTGEVRRRKVEKLSTARGRAERFLRGQHRRGFAMTVVVTVVAMPFLGFEAFDAERPWLAVPGFLLLGAFCLAMCVRWRKLRPQPPEPTMPVREAVNAEIEKLRFAEGFWGKPSRSWTAVFVAGEILLFEGFRAAGAERYGLDYGFYVFLFAVVGGVAFWNPIYARRKIQPLREELESWMEGLNAFEEPEGYAPGSGSV